MYYFLDSCVTFFSPVRIRSGVSPRAGDLIYHQRPVGQSDVKLHSRGRMPDGIYITLGRNSRLSPANRINVMHNDNYHRCRGRSLPRVLSLYRRLTFFVRVTRDYANEWQCGR